MNDDIDTDDFRANIVEFVNELQALENEASELRERKKELFQRFEGKFDKKTVQAALRVSKALDSVTHKSEFDAVMSVLETEFAVLP